MLLFAQWHFQGKGSLIYFARGFQMLHVFEAFGSKSTPQRKETVMGYFSMQIYHLAAVSELRGAVLTAPTWDVGNSGSAPRFGVWI